MEPPVGLVHFRGVVGLNVLTYRTGGKGTEFNIHGGLYIYIIVSLFFSLLLFSFLIADFVD